MKRCKLGNGRKASSSSKKLAKEENQVTKNWGTTILDITTCVLVEIFLRFPATSISCCKAVCKEWHTLLSQSVFCTSFQKNPTYLTLVHSNFIKKRNKNSGDQVDVFHLISLKEDNQTSQEPICTKRLHLPIKDGMVEIKGSWNGLLCLVQLLNHTASFHITNPMTKEYISLPRLTSCGRTINRAYGFGFGTNYMALRIQTYRLSKGELRADGEIFRIGVDNKWRELEDTSAAYCVNGSATVINGAFHWLVDRKSTAGIRVNNLILSNIICAFDILEERFRPIPPPPEHIIDNGTNSVLGNISGHLCIFDVSRSLLKVDMWMMNEYGNADSWTKQSVLNCWLPMYGVRFVHPPTTSWRDGELLAHSICSPHLISFNPRARMAEVLGVSGLEGVSQMMAKLTSYVPNFLPLKEALRGGAALKGKYQKIPKVRHT